MGRSGENKGDPANVVRSEGLARSELASPATMSILLAYFGLARDPRRNYFNSCTLFKQKKTHYLFQIMRFLPCAVLLYAKLQAKAVSVVVYQYAEALAMD